MYMTNKYYHCLFCKRAFIDGSLKYCFGINKNEEVKEKRMVEGYYDVEFKCPFCANWNSVAKMENKLPVKISIPHSCLDPNISLIKDEDINNMLEANKEFTYKTIDEDLMITKKTTLEKLIFRSEFLDKVFETNKNLFGQYVQELEKKIFVK